MSANKSLSVPDVSNSHHIKYIVVWIVSNDQKNLKRSISLNKDFHQQIFFGIIAINQIKEKKKPTMKEKK